MSTPTLRQRLGDLYHRLYQTATTGRLNPFLKPVHSSLQALELAVERQLDRLSPTEEPSPHLPELTVLIKTFERPYATNLLLESIRRFYPQLPIIVVDDSRNPTQFAAASQTIFMPYDSGLSAGRMAGLEHIHTPYTLLLDDDYVFYRHTRINSALSLMVQHPEIDIMGGTLIYLPFYTTTDYRKAALYKTDVPPVHPLGSKIGGLTVMDKVANFFIAQTERLKLVGWDTQLKLMEHAEFFTRARGILTTVYNPQMRCLHVRTPFDKVYMKGRNNYLPYVVFLQRRYQKAPHEIDT